MMNRRAFLTGSLALAAGVALPGKSPLLGKEKGKRMEMKTGTPKKAAVVWYSQTGNTGRYGRLIAKTWEKLGLRVTASHGPAHQPDAILSVNHVSSPGWTPSKCRVSVQGNRNRQSAPCSWLSRSSAIQNRETRFASSVV